MFAWLDRIALKIVRILRTEGVIRKPGSSCYCPTCKSILDGYAIWIGGQNPYVGTFRCDCGTISRWDVWAPIPYLLDYQEKK